MTKLILSSMPEHKLILEADGKMLHGSLKNLDFEKSGHRGFQKELTDEQLKNITDVPNKEDATNKVKNITGDSTDKQYPTAKAVYEGIQEKTAWELIDSAELTENVVSITPAMNGKYKELYLALVVPTLNPNKQADFSKGRFNLIDQSGNRIYDAGTYNLADNGSTWYVVFHVRAIGNICKVERIFKYNFNRTQGCYPGDYLCEVIAPLSIARDGYFSAIRADFYSQNSVRCLPVGTTYELWGIRA